MKTLDLVLDRFIDLTPITPEQGIIQIYRAFHVHRCTDVLLKMVANITCIKEVSAAIEAQNRVCLEAQATQRVNHPNVVRVIDASTGPTLNTFVALEYLNGRNLAEHLETAAPMSVPHVLEIAIPIARAIEASHRAGVIHGDIKPSNIMLVEEGPKLIDFGCASSPILALYRPRGKATGTYAYMCPVYRATAVPSERSDIFSFGILLYEMLTGFNPYADAGRSLVSETFTKRRPSRSRHQRRVPPLDQLAPAVPPGLACEIHRAIARTPDERQQSMAELLSALEVQQLRLDSVEPLKNGIALDDKYATAGGGVPALARALDKLAEELSPPTCSGQGTGFRHGFFAGAVPPKALEGARHLPALMAHKSASSLQAVFTGKADASPLLKVKARDEAVTVPGVDADGLALCAGTFATLGCGTTATHPMVVRSSARTADLGGPQTLSFVSCPDGISPASRQTLAGGFTLQALRITIDPSAAIQAAMASDELEPPTLDAVRRALERATPTPVRALRSRMPPDKGPFGTLPTGTMVRGPAPLRAHARSVAVTGPETRPLGTLIVCSPRATTPTQVAVAHKLEPETTVAEPVPVPESAKLAVSAAVRIAPARRVRSEAASTPSARKLVLVSSPSSKPSAPSSKEALKDARVYAGVPVRRAAKVVTADPSSTAPFAEILAMNSDDESSRRVASLCGSLALAAGVLLWSFGAQNVLFPKSSARIVAPPVASAVEESASPTAAGSAVSHSAPSAYREAATEAVSSSDPVTSVPPTVRSASTSTPGAVRKQVPSSRERSQQPAKKCQPGAYSPNCDRFTPLPLRLDPERTTTSDSKRSQMDPLIVDPWAEERGQKQGRKTMQSLPAAPLKSSLGPRS